MIRPNMKPSGLNGFYQVMMVIFLIAVSVVAMRDKFPKWFSKDPPAIDDCATEMHRTFSGTVNQAYYDNTNEKAFVIYFTNGFKYITPTYLKSLEGEIEPGDSVVKDEGAFRFEIFKKGATRPVIHEDKVDCDGQVEQHSASIN